MRGQPFNHEIYRNSKRIPCEKIVKLWIAKKLVDLLSNYQSILKYTKWSFLGSYKLKISLWRSKEKGIDHKKSKDTRVIKLKSHLVVGWKVTGKGCWNRKCINKMILGGTYENYWSPTQNDMGSLNWKYNVRI